MDRPAILRLAPGDGHVLVEVNAACSGLLLEGPHWQEAAGVPRGTADIAVPNSVDIKITPFHEDGLGIPRLVRCGPVPGVAVNYIHPHDYAYWPSGRSPASPSLVRTPGGDLLASHDIFWGGADQNRTLLFRSRDDGASWEAAGELAPCFWGKLFCHDGILYMLGTSTEYGALLLYCSADDGASWSAPVTLLPGGSDAFGGPHKAPMPVISHAGRLWTAIDFGSWGSGGFANGLLSCACGSNLMDPTQWVCSGFTAYDPQWPGTAEGPSVGCLEGNAVPMPDGSIGNILRYQTDHASPSYGLALALRGDPSQPGQPLVFSHTLPFPGNLSKFSILYDPVSACYWSIATRITGDPIWRRDRLSLLRSRDLSEFTLVCDVLELPDAVAREGLEHIGLQYVDFIIEGEDILFVCRTAVNEAHNFHNANHLTFHRIHHFRTL